MSYTKMMKRGKPGKYKNQPMLFHAESFTGKSVYSDERECPVCGYIRPVIFFKDGKCDLCNKTNNPGW